MGIVSEGQSLTPHASPLTFPSRWNAFDLSKELYSIKSWRSTGWEVARCYQWPVSSDQWLNKLVTGPTSSRSWQYSTVAVWQGWWHWHQLAAGLKRVAKMEVQVVFPSLRNSCWLFVTRWLWACSSANTPRASTLEFFFLDFPGAGVLESLQILDGAGSMNG